MSLLLVTTDKLCRTLTNFKTATENELKKMTQEQMGLLNVQEQYKNEIKAEADKILGNTYQAIKDNQKSAFDTMFSEVQTAVDSMKTDIVTCTETCKSASTAAENSLKKLCRITRLEDLIYYLCPLLVLGDVVLRLLDIFLF